MEQKVSRFGVWHNLAQLIMPSRVGLAFGTWHFPLGNAMPCQGHAPSLKNQLSLADHYAKIFRELVASNTRTRHRSFLVTGESHFDNVSRIDPEVFTNR
jgi:hypothetical protein